MSDKITATFVHPAYAELPWTEEIVASAVGKPFTLAFDVEGESGAATVSGEPGDLGEMVDVIEDRVCHG